MADHWKRSRVTKALTDSGRAKSFEEAEVRLNAVRIEVVVGADQLTTRAGQAAALTAVATAKKCFGRVRIIAVADVPLIAPMPIGGTLLKAARRLGATVSAERSTQATHVIQIGSDPRSKTWTIRCWWDRWQSGARAFDDDSLGDSRMPLSGVFAGAIAVRQVFAGVLSGRTLPVRDVTVSLWTPWQAVNRGDIGPAHFDVPDKLWFLALGHLGQGFVWNLCFLPGKGDRLAILQDDQKISEENEATSLLVLPGGRGQIGERKVRVAASWLKAGGWETQLIERRHCGDIVRTDDDPPYLLSGLDTVEPRLVLAKHGFPFMVDAGIGHGPGDFDGIQVRTIVNGRPEPGLWEAPEEAEVSERRAKVLSAREAYRDLEQQIGTCGIVSFTEASVAVPFVGAATGALVIAQAIRLASLQSTPVFMQMELGSPDMTTLAELITTPETNLGSFSIQLK